jgi:hypothetical protein
VTNCILSRHLRKIVESDYLFFYVCLSYGTTQLPLDGFSLNLIFEGFSKICRESSDLIKM